MIDIKAIRSDTKYCESRLFVNSAGSSLPPKQVNSKIISYLEDEEREGGYLLEELRGEEIKSFYSNAAQLINCRKDQIAFTFNATDSYARALSSIDFKKNDIILTTEDDYLSNQIAFISLKKRFGIQIARGRRNPIGVLDIDHFCDQIISIRPKLVCVTHVPTNSGTIQDVQRIGQVCNEQNILYLVDACQSVGQFPVDVQKIKCDFLSTTGRKFLRGPRGTGLLYVSDKVLSSDLTPLFIDMRGADWNQRDNYSLFDGARRFEMWEFPYALMVGLSEAIRYANEVGIHNIAEYNSKICGHLREQMKHISGINLYDQGESLSSIITFQKEGRSLEETKHHLDQNKVYFSLSSITGALLDYQQKGIEWSIRISPHYFNTFQEMDSLCEILEAF